MQPETAASQAVESSKGIISILKESTWHNSHIHPKEPDTNIVSKLKHSEGYYTHPDIALLSIIKHVKDGSHSPAKEPSAHIINRSKMQSGMTATHILKGIVSRF